MVSVQNVTIKYNTPKYTQARLVYRQQTGRCIEKKYIASYFTNKIVYLVLVKYQAGFTRKQFF